MLKPRFLILACVLLAMSMPSVFGAATDSDAGKYVTRKDYNKLSHRLDAVTRKLNKLESTAATKKQTQEYLDFVNREMKSIKRMAAFEKAGTTHFTVVGDASLTYQNKAGSTNTFGWGFGPMFLWQLNKRLLLETGFDIGINDAGNGFAFDLGMANVSYMVNDHLALGAGLFATPFGIFHNHLDPAWVYKLPDAPMAWDDGGIAPDRTMGLFANGAFAVGQNSMFTYDFYVGNGASLDTGTRTLNFSNFNDQNNRKSIGGRVSYLPIPALEVGYSFDVGRVDQTGSTTGSVDSLLQGVDFTFKKDIPEISGTIDFRAEWLWSHTDKASYGATTDSGGTVFPAATFTNNSQGGYVQLAYRPSDLSNKVLKNMEVVGRYDMLRQPVQQPDWVKQDRYTVGLNYWLNPSTVIETAYEWYAHTHGADKQDGLVFSYGIGF